MFDPDQKHSTKKTAFLDPNPFQNQDGPGLSSSFNTYTAGIFAPYRGCEKDRVHAAPCVRLVVFLFEVFELTTRAGPVSFPVVTANPHAETNSTISWSHFFFAEGSNQLLFEMAQQKTPSPRFGNINSAWQKRSKIVDLVFPCGLGWWYNTNTPGKCAPYRGCV